MKHHFFVICLLVIVGFSFARQVEASSAFELLSFQQEKLIGRNVIASFEKQVSLEKNAALNAYVTALGQTLLALRKRKQTPFRYRFKVINANHMNALAFPGGTIYLYKGLLRRCRNEAELAFVIGHEIGHIERRHFARSIRRKALYQKAVSLATKVLESGKKTRILLKLGTIFALLHYSRRQEEDADKMGVRLMRRAGFDTLGALQLLSQFRQKKASKHSRLLHFLSTHPAPTKRIKKLKRYIKRLRWKHRWSLHFGHRMRQNKRQPRITSQAFQTMKKLLR